MALEDNGAMNSMVMPVSPMYGGNYGGNGMFGGDNWAWIILLLLLGWGNNGWGNNAGGGGSAGGMYPWMNQVDVTNNGFRDQALMGAVNGIQSGVQNLGTQMCNGFNGTQMAVMQGINQVGTQLANCCCENRLASANLQSVVQSENCADRTALADGLRDVIESQNAGFQRILDTMCQDKIDAKNDEIANLRTQLNLANLAASQGAQTAQLIADNNAQTAQLIQRIAPYPTPSWIVPNPYAYASNYTCGCNA
jgi:hypothetical protein